MNNLENLEKIFFELDEKMASEICGGKGNKNKYDWVNAFGQLAESLSVLECAYGAPCSVPVRK
ncbi:hypothetical protein AB1395_03470 [Streptococcus pluranimalium]|uniref:hypothetical protein n=1 Tax=Streptococcus pluranimalium TaxID=82348 RepID=UPI002414DFC0|nr:hypothetical protein [Streptococcus pluranimalium]WFM80492.1 hypothetical protein P7F70_03540 [Streptococcus pluranimalium]